MRVIQISSVSCDRRGTFDAELQFKWGEFDNPNYKQVLISAGHASSKEAKDAAQVVADDLEKAVTNAAISFMYKYKDAQP